MLPATFMRGIMAEKCGTLNSYAHEGEKYEQIGLAIADEYHIPHFRLRARMIQLGHIYAKGALNYVDRVGFSRTALMVIRCVRVSTPST